MLENGLTSDYRLLQTQKKSRMKHRMEDIEGDLSKTGCGHMAGRSAAVPHLGKH